MCVNAIECPTLRGVGRREMLEMGVRPEVKRGTYCGGGRKEENITLETKPTEC